MIALTINSEAQEVADGSTVADLVGVADDERRGVAVARNGEVVPRSEWENERVESGDQIEILRAAQGG